MSNKHILDFIKDVCDKNYSDAEKNLQLAINEKIKDRIRGTMVSEEEDSSADSSKS